MQRFEVSGAVRPLYGSLGVKVLMQDSLTELKSELRSSSRSARSPVTGRPAGHTVSSRFAENSKKTKSNNWYYYHNGRSRKF